ncbi:hypothetical protein [Aurantibacter sp.]|uniref:hypothetical protein n=1 Tax=Aurantibacter sp. TaxID=2807103 RepID=UPI003262F2C9
MKKYILLLLLAIPSFYACGQGTNNATAKTAASKTKYKSEIKTEGFSRDSYLHTEASYLDTTGKGIIIQNSYPRGGPINTPDGKYGHALFWSRVINKADTPIALNLHFPADSIVIDPATHTYFKLLVPPDKMTPDKVSTFGFGLDYIEDFVAENFYKPSYLQKTIKPNEDAMFYVILLSHLAPTDRGVIRTGLFLDGQDLFYKLEGLNSQKDKFVPSGSITFKD